ncbi:MAG: hypothetical protein R3B93_02980 [Bacteroidia bacterium]
MIILDECPFLVILEPDGTISDVRILFGLSKEYNDEVERVVKKAPSHLFPVEIAIDFQAPVFYVYSYTFLIDFF